MLLSGPHWSSESKPPRFNTVPDKTVTCQASLAIWYPAGMVTLPEEEKVMIQLEDGDDDDDPEKTGRWNLGIHSACEELALRVMQTSLEARIRSIGHLWMTLDRRCTRTLADRSYFSSFLPTIPENLPCEPVALSLRRYYIPSDAIPGDQVGYHESVEEWVSGLSPELFVF